MSPSVASHQGGKTCYNHPTPFVLHPDLGRSFYAQSIHT